MRTILAIDPGNIQSGWVRVDLESKEITGSGVIRNEFLLESFEHSPPGEDVAIEWIQAMGMPCGQEVFQTCLWVGMFVREAQQNSSLVRLIHRNLIRQHHCQSARAKDSNIIQSLKDKYGSKGTKGNPGYFYGVSSHAWQAFAVAAYCIEGARSNKEIHL